MNDLMLEQARILHRTARELRNRVMLKHPVNGESSECNTPELTVPQWNTLLAIRDNGPTSVKELAEAMSVSPPSASAMVDRLVEMGMVDRRHSDVDRREVRVSLTGEGAAAVEAMEGELLSSIIEVLEKLGPDMANQWCEVYARIQDVLDADRERSSVRGRKIADRSSVA
ncbi:MAG: MarR family transcriptional regulator [Candidatus Hydrogenedentota bacterium]